MAPVQLQVPALVAAGAAKSFVFVISSVFVFSFVFVIFFVCVVFLYLLLLL